MMLKALIVEQLERDGTLRSMRMLPATGREIVVSFAGKYEEQRHGPFHFLDDEDEQRYREGFANCRARRLAGPNFIFYESSYHVETSWSGIPTERNCLSYYALSLPEFAIPKHISISDPYRAAREYGRFVTRDDERHRWIIYLECTSSRGRFDFELSCDFEIDKVKFSGSEYHDPKTAECGRRGDIWECWLDESEVEKVQQFFIGSMQVGDNYSAGQAGAMGPNAQAAGNTFQQIWQQNQGRIDLAALATELEALRREMREEATAPAHDVAIGEVAAAQAAAAEGKGAKALEHLRNAGRWAFDVSTKIGVGVATGALKAVLGL